MTPGDDDGESDVGDEASSGETRNESEPPGNRPDAGEGTGGEATGAEGIGEPAGADRKRRFSPGKVLATVGAVVGLAAGVLALVFGLDPGLRPCLGNSQGTISLTVVPHVSHWTYLLRQGSTRAAVQAKDNYLGAEVRYTVATEGLRDHNLVLKYSLFDVFPDGTLGPIAGGIDRLNGPGFRPSSCSEEDGYDLLVQIPKSGRRYRILLELFHQDREGGGGRPSNSEPRINLVTSETFRD